jgi:hypothetical protein
VAAAFVVGSLFGWHRSDGLRRFRTAYCAVPRKNGKSTLSAGIALYLLVADGEQGAEVYSAATTRDQARIVFDEAKRMVRSSPALGRRVQVLINNLNVEASASRFMPLSSDASSMDGLNVHGAIIDELHAHKTRHVVDVLETATGARRQPLLFEITTAGYDRHSICFEHHDYAIKLLEGTLQDDSWFAYIASADEDDDWTDPEVWRKANPSFGLSVKADDLARKAEKAIALPGAQNAFRRMHLNEWTEQAERWIDLAAWDACSVSGRPRGAAGSSLLRRPRSLHHHRRYRARLGVPARGRGWPLVRSVALLCAGGASQEARRARPCTLRPVDPAGLYRGDGGQCRRLRRHRAADPCRQCCSRSRRSPTTPGTPLTSPCACRTRGPPWSNSTRAFARWRRRPASSRS